MDRTTTQARAFPILTRFAELLRNRIGAERVILFGSQAHGSADPESDYDPIVVSERFAGARRRERSLGLRELFYEVGGYAPLDLICLTPGEFEAASRRISLISAVLPEAIDLLPSEHGRTA